MTDMATAFAVFANAGIRQDINGILKITDLNGKTLEEFKEIPGKRVLPMEVTYLISHILLDNNARSAAFGPSSYLVIKNHPEVSVKTGTTNDKRDNWTIGYTPGYVTTVWVGNNDNTPMSNVASGITGASPIWNKIMSFILKDQSQEWPTRPKGIIGTQICNLSGKAIPDEGCQSRYEYFIEGAIPREKEILKQTVLIDKTTNWPVQEGLPATDPNNVEYQEHQIITDPLNTVLCLDCPPSDKPINIAYPLKEGF